MSAEEWRPVVGYEGFYEVSSHGRVRSVDRIVYHPQAPARLRSRVLRPATHKQGYLMVVLHRDGRPRTWMVHILVAEAFVGPRPDGMDVRHLNDVKSDNRPENLRYGTRSQNAYDSVRNGTHAGVRKTHCKNGHEFTPENTKLTPQSSGQGTFRACRTCLRVRAAARRERMKANA